MIAALWTSVTGVFWKYLAYITVAGFVAIAAIAGVLWLQKAVVQKRLDAVQITAERQRVTITSLNAALIDRDDAIATLEWANRTREAQTAELSQLLQEIANAPPADDGAIARVLDLALRRLRPAGAAR